MIARRYPSKRSRKTAPPSLPPPPLPDATAVEEASKLTLNIIKSAKEGKPYNKQGETKENAGADRQHANHPR